MKQSYMGEVVLRRTESCHGEVRGLIFCHNLLYSSSIDNVVRGWDSNGVLKREMKFDEQVSLVKSSDNLLYTHDSLFQVRLWNENGENVGTLYSDSPEYGEIWYNRMKINIKNKKNFEAIHAYYDFMSLSRICYFNDVTYACHMDTTLHVWKNGELYQKIEGHSEPVEDYVCTADGKFMYTCSADGTIHKWNCDNKCIGIIRHFTGGIPPAGVFKLAIFNDLLYAVDETGYILTIGEYFQHHYSGLPTFQKVKLSNWRSVSRAAAVHKDIGFLFERELLI